MKRERYKAVFTAVVVSVLFSCTSLPPREQPDVVLRAGKVYEECVPLTAPQVMDYSFSATKPLEFNIHYHSDKVVYPVMGEAVQTWSGVFDPTSIHSFSSSEQPPFFCLMWTNPHDEEVGLNYEFTIRDKE
jgi:hypothetical protein